MLTAEMLRTQAESEGLVAPGLVEDLAIGGQAPDVPHLHLRAATFAHI